MTFRNQLVNVTLRKWPVILDHLLHLLWWSRRLGIDVRTFLLKPFRQSRPSLTDYAEGPDRTTTYSWLTLSQAQGPCDPFRYLQITFFLYHIKAYHYTHVIEIGAWDGQLSAALAHACPDISFIAIDIHDQMDDLNHINQHSNLEMFQGTLQDYLLRNPIQEFLFICKGTLICMKPDDICSLFLLLKEKKADLAFWEPCRCTFQTQSFIAYYGEGGGARYSHPYDQILSDQSYNLIFDSKSIGLFYAKNRYYARYIYAQYPHKNLPVPDHKV